MSKMFRSLLLAFSIIFAGWLISQTGVNTISYQLDLIQKAAEEQGGRLRIVVPSAPAERS